MVFVFGDHVLDVDRRELRRRGGRIALEPQVFDLLVYLLRNRDRVVSKDDLLETIWGGRIVSESTITSRINAVRKAVGDSGEAQLSIRTVPRRGIRFIGEVREEEKPAPSVDTPRAVAEDAQSPTAVVSSDAKSAARLSIVVLPFVNLSSDPEQEYFADGITDDLTTDLSRLADMLVISRNTASTYRNKPVDTRQIGRELGVRYVLEGSVRRSGNQVRVNAQLIDAETGVHLWAERFDSDIVDLFALQNEVTARIGNTLNRELIAAEATRPIECPDALDYIFRGRALFVGKSPSRDTDAERISMFERALVLDPRSVEAQSRLAVVLADRVLNGMTDTAAADLARAEGQVNQALAASPRSAYAHFVKGHVLRTQNRWEEAIPEFQMALALDRNLPAALNGLAWCKLYAGSIEQVIPLVEQAIRLSPRDPGGGYWYYLIGTVHLLQSHIDEAIVWLEKARTAMPAVPFHRSDLASAYALRGETERAAAELAEARRLDGGGLFSSIAHLKALPGAWWGVPKIRALHEATYFAGLRKARMPEE